MAETHFLDSRNRPKMGNLSLLENLEFITFGVALSASSLAIRMGILDRRRGFRHEPPVENPETTGSS